jgi:hypothetical protein
MKSIATLDPESAAKLKLHLSEARIPSHTQNVAEQSGVLANEVFVEDSFFDIACDTAEAWQSQVSDELARQKKNVCPKCGSPHLDRVNHESLEVVFGCKDCGCIIVAQA